MTTISGTTHAAVTRASDGFAFTRPEDRCVIELGAGLAGVVTITPGGDVEVAPVDHTDQPTGGWTSWSAGQSFPVAEGQRVAARMVGVGGAGLRVALSGPGLEALRNYDGTPGSLG